MLVLQLCFTITDVYSYAEDNMVVDPYLSQHLEHFGIDIMKMKQTEKTMVEMEIQYNLDVSEYHKQIPLVQIMCHCITVINIELLLQN